MSKISWICFELVTWAATWALWFKIRIQKSIIEKVPAYSTDSVAELSVPELRNLWLRMHMESGYMKYLRGRDTRTMIHDL